MHKAIRYVYAFILFLTHVLPLEAICGSLMVGPGSQIINNITNVSSGYDPSLNFGNGTSTGVPVGGGMPIIPGLGTGQIPMLAPGATGGNAFVPWGQSSMIVPPLQQMMSTGMTPGMMPGSMPPGMMPPNLMPGMMPGMMGPGQAAAMGVMAQLGPNAAMMTALSGQAGTLGSAALGLPMNTGLSSSMMSSSMSTMMPNMMSSMMSGMTPGMSPFGGTALPGMPFQDPSMMGMMMANMALSGTGFSSMGLGNMSTQNAMMMFLPQFQQQYSQMQATTTAKTFRIVSSLTNQALVGKTEAQLKKYQSDLETLTSVPEENLPEGVDAVSVDTQLSRINIALTDKGSLMADPDSRTVPDVGLRSERNARLNALLTKWTTPDGGTSSKPSPSPLALRAPLPPVQPRTPVSSVGTYQSTNSLALAKVKEAIDKIEEDERQLTIAKEELSATQDREMIRRIDIAVYNTLIAKARQYDNLMDSITRQTWEQIIDQERGLSTSSLQLTGTTAGTPARRLPPRATPRSPLLPTTPQPNQFGRDEVLEIQREIQAVLNALNARQDMSVGGDIGMKAQLETHLQKLDSIVKAFNDPTLPNPFRTGSPEMQQVLTLWTQMNSMSLEDLQKMTPQTLQANIQIFENVLLNPKPRLHPQIKYSEVQDLFDRLVSVLASLEYNDANNKQGAATRTGFGGTMMRLTTGGTARSMYNEGIGLVTYLKKGYYERSTLNSLDQSVTWDAAVDLVKQINVRSAQSKVWSSGSNRGTRVSNAQNVLKDLVEKFPKLLEDEGSVMVSDLTRVYGTSRLASFWSNLGDYFYNADFATWPDTLATADGKPAASAATSTQRRSFFGWRR